MSKGVVLAFLAGVLLATFVSVVPTTIRRFSPV